VGPANTGAGSTRGPDAVVSTPRSLDELLGAAGFAAKPGAASNSLGFPQSIVHVASGVELAALGYASNAKPLLYVAVSKITELQFDGKGSKTKSKGRVSALEAHAWCSRRGLELPSEADWAKIGSARQPEIQIGASSGYEWLRWRDKTSDSEWPTANPSGQVDSRRTKATWSSEQLGFRAVKRVP
jgi:hypothetical protein